MLSLREFGVVIGTAAFVATLPLTAVQAHAPEHTGLTLRYSGQGWANFSQASGPFVRSGSSQAIVAVPDGSTIDWAGLYWGSGPEARASCARNEAATIQLSLGESRSTIYADSLTGAQGTAYQAYADITPMVEGTTRGLRVVTVSGVAATAGCASGWTILVAYSYPNGPHETYADSHRSLTVYDGLLPRQAGDIQLGLPPVPAGKATVNVAILGNATLSNDGAAVPTEATGTGYRAGAGPLAAGSLSYSSTGYAGLVLGITVNQPAPAGLAMNVSASPAEVDVGGTSTLRLSVINRGPTPVTDAVIVAKIPTTLALQTVVDDYEAGTGIWTPRTIAAHDSVVLTLRVRVTTPGTHPWNARVATTTTNNRETTDDRASLGDHASLVVTGLTVPDESPPVVPVQLGPAAAVPPTPGFAPGAPWASVPAGAYFAVALTALSLMVPLALRLNELRPNELRRGAPSRRTRRDWPGTKRPLVHPPELTYPCCLPALGRFVR